MDRLLQFEWSGDCSLADVIWMDWYLVVCLQKVFLQKHVGSSKVGSKVVYVGQRIVAKYCDNIEATIIAIRTPNSSFFLGNICSGDNQELLGGLIMPS